MPAMADSGIDVVLFDLGGVLFDPGGVAPMRALSGIDDEEELWRRWLSCPWVRAFESGHCSKEEFATGLVDDWRLEIEPAAFLQAFAGWPTGPYPGAEELLRATREFLPVGCLSNTNGLHWTEHFSRWSVLGELDYCFLSFELGQVKPDREIFELVAARLDAPAKRVLFIDDNAINVEGAASVGFEAVRAQGVDEARGALRSLDVLPGP
jgi:glucose-1-phosphatase